MQILGSPCRHTSMNYAKKYQAELQAGNYYINKQLDATLCSLIYSLLRFTLHVLGAFCTHHQEYNQTVVTVIGTFLVSVWCGLNLLLRCPRSGIYCTVSWPS
jgi:hypothetical protein